MARPSKAEIVKYWKDWLIAHGFNLGEPACWACSCWWEPKYDIKDPNASWDEIYNCWNKVRQLQRCHIIPESLGGSNEDPSNLFLMCKQCHDLAPDTTSKEMFFTWIEKQSWLKRIYEEIKKDIANFDIAENEYEEVVKIIRSPDFKD